MKQMHEAAVSVSGTMRDTAPPEHESSSLVGHVRGGGWSRCAKQNEYQSWGAREAAKHLVMSGDAVGGLRNVDTVVSVLPC